MLAGASSIGMRWGRPADANATLAIRNAAIWGEAGTACASDSKKFGAWDGNLMTEWHVRYGRWLETKTNYRLRMCSAYATWVDCARSTLARPALVRRVEGR